MIESIEEKNHKTIIAVEILANKAHEGQLRRSGDKNLKVPYITHPINVRKNIVDALNAQPSLYKEIEEDFILAMLSAALLHDVIEDSNYNTFDIIQASNDLTASIVLEVTDPEDIPKDVKAKKAFQANRAKKYTRYATNIKISDQTENLRDIVKLKPKWDRNKILSYVEGAILIVESTPENFRFKKLVSDFDIAADNAIKYAKTID